MLEELRPSQLLQRNTALSRSSNTAAAANMDSKGGVSKWKNKIKSFLTSPLPNHKSLSPEPTISNSKAGDIFVSDSSNYASTGDDSYEARLSRLVGDLENVDYGAAQQSHIQQWDDSPVLGNLHPFAWATSPESQPPVSINDALDAFPQSLNDYVTFADFGDIEVPSLDNTPTPASTVGPASSAIVSNASSASSSSNASKSGVSNSKSGTPPAKESRKKEKAQQNMLSPPGGPTISVPFNSPADNTDMTEASIASLSMPFSFEDLQNMGLVAGGALDVGGGSPEDDLSRLLASTQAIINSTTSDDINADFSQYTFNLFPSSNAIPSPTSSGPSPALSYGESSTSNNSFDETLLQDPLALRKRGMSVTGLQGLFTDLPQAVKTPTHSPQHSVNSSIPPTPSSFKAPSAPSSPYKRPAIHASALTWRVAPTALSPKSSIAVNSSKPMRTSSSQQSFLGQDPHTAGNRMNRINTASVPELKRRREEDQTPIASHSMHQRGYSNDSRPIYENAQQPRPIAGRRRVAAMQPPQSRKPVRSASHHQLYQQSQAQMRFAPPLPLSQTSWIDEDAIRNLYGQIDARTFMCRLQGCNSTSMSEQQMRQHVQSHYTSPSNQTTQQLQMPQAIWS